MEKPSVKSRVTRREATALRTETLVCLHQYNDRSERCVRTTVLLYSSLTRSLVCKFFLRELCVDELRSDCQLRTIKCGALTDMAETPPSARFEITKKQRGAMADEEEQQRIKFEKVLPLDSSCRLACCSCAPADHRAPSQETQ